MPKRVIDFEAMWASDKLATCPVWARREYAWLYGLADASGSFELTNLRVLWGKVAAIRPDLSIKRLEQILTEFHGHGLLFLWERSGKRYGHWTGSDVPGRLPPPSWRARLERLAPPVPAHLLAGYLKSFATSCLNQGLEAPQAENRDLDSKWEREEREASPAAPTVSGQVPVGSGQAPIAGHGCEAEAQRYRSNGSTKEGDAALKGGATQSVAPGVAPGFSPAGVEECHAEAERFTSTPTGSGPAPPEPATQGPGPSSRTSGRPAPYQFGTGPAPGTLHEIWEQERGPLPAVQAITRDRLSKCATRLKNRPGDAERFLCDFRAAVRKASETPFLLGENERGWRVSFDWFIANDTNYLKVLEGRYDGTQRANPTRAAERRSVTARALSRVFAGARELAGPVQRALPAGDQRAECSGLPRRPGGPNGRPA